VGGVVGDFVGSAVIGLVVGKFVGSAVVGGVVGDSVGSSSSLSVIGKGTPVTVYVNGGSSLLGPSKARVASNTF